MTDRAHLLLAVITVLALGYVLSMLRDGRLRARFALLWTVVGIGLAILASFPSLLDWTADRVGVFYPPAVFLMASTAFLFLVAVQFSYEISRLEERTRVLAEEIALLRHEREEGAVDAPAERGDDHHPT